MANDDCLPQVQACAIRVAYLDSSGVPRPGSNNLYVTDALTEMKVTPVYEDGDEITEKNACGRVVINYKGDPTLKRGDGTLSIFSQDPYLTTMLGGGEVLTDSGLHGFAFPQIGVINTQDISIELWSKRIDDGELHDEFPYAWWVFPRVSRVRHAERTFNSGPNVPAFSMELYENPNWFDGPLNDWPVSSDRLAQWFPTTGIPTISCGPQALAAS
jgi:hypothetical protein